MPWLASLLPRWLVTFFVGDQTDPASLRDAVLANLRDNRGVSSPQLMAIDLAVDVSVVEGTCRLLVKEGKIRRLENERQIVQPGKDEGIPSPYVRYELVPS